MKWKHKIMGWEARTPYYDIELSKSVSFSYEAEGLKRTVNLPYDVVVLDENWEELPDGRWLDEQFTVREFMEAFAMCIAEGATCHDSLVGKVMVDRKMKKRHEKEDI
jgi:hypothetical protein